MKANGNFISYFGCFNIHSRTTTDVPFSMVVPDFKLIRKTTIFATIVHVFSLSHDNNKRKKQSRGDS